MKDYGIDKGMIEFRDDSARNQRGWGKGFWGFRKMFRDYNIMLNVPFYDSCCPALTGDIFPVRYDASEGLQRYNGTTWVTVDTTPLSITTDTIAEQTAGAGVTVESVKIEDGGISNAGETMFASFYPTAAQQNITAGTGGAINVTSFLTTINTDAGGDAFTLANGTQIGQMKRIRLVADGGGDGVVTPATALLGGATTITFNDAADFVDLMWTGAAWAVLDNSGTTIA